MSTREEKIHRLLALKEQRRRREAAPLFFFEPHQKQLAALGAFVGNDLKRAFLYVAGNRSGKTTIVVYMLFVWWYGYFFHLLPQNLRQLTEDGDYPPRDQIPPEYWVRRPDGVPMRQPSHILFISGLSLVKGIGRILWPKIEEFLPSAVKAPGRLQVRRGALSVPIACTNSYGATITLGSQEQGSMAFEGANYDAVAFDEPVKKAVFTAAWRGLIDHYGPFCMGFTPLGPDAAWTHREFVLAGRKDIQLIRSSQDENPHLSAKALEEFEEGVDFTEEELAARKHGKWGHLTHRAFPLFDPTIHVIPPFQIPDNWPRVCACDPANRRPFFLVWLAYDSVRDTWIVYDEYPKGVPYMQIRSSTTSVREYSSIIRNMEGGRPADVRYIDPRFGPAEYTVKGQKLTSVVDDFADFGLYFDARVPDVARIETGIVKIRELLSYDRSLPVSALNRPKLLITSDCINVAEAFANYSFVPPAARDEHQLDERTLEAYKDAIDAIRYAILPGPPCRLDRHRGGHSSLERGALEDENNFDLFS